MQAGDVLAGVSEILQDTGQVTWTEPQLLGWLNEALLSVCLLRQDAYTATESVKLAPGTRQVKPGGSRQILDVTRNMGADGNTVGRVIHFADLHKLDLINPNWHLATPKTVVREWFRDQRSPDVYYVYPPVPSNPDVYVQVLVSKTPPEIVTPAEPILLSDEYSPALREWVLYRAFGRDSENTPNASRSMGYIKSFFNLLGVKTPVDVAFSAEVTEGSV